MATQLYGVNNLTDSTLTLTNTIGGKVKSSDSAEIPPRSFKRTGGADGNFIEIPDATPLAEFFSKDNTNISGIEAGGMTQQVYFAKTGGGSKNTVSWSANGFTNPTQLTDTANYTKAVAVVSVNGTSPTLTMQMYQD
jgi:hypothetical protein